MLRRSSGASDDRPSEPFGRQNDFCNPATAFGNFLFVEDLVNCRNVGHALVPLVARKEQNPDKVLFLPRKKWFAPMERRGGHAATDDLASFHCQVDFRTARIAQYS